MAQRLDDPKVLLGTMARFQGDTLPKTNMEGPKMMGLEKVSPFIKYGHV